jgi:nitrile hydratase subunit beta
MNSVHDLGGTDGFGPVRPELNEPVFHEPWEGRVFAMTIIGAGHPPSPIDAGRHRIERLDPIRYLASSYYERWLAALENAILEAGTLTRDEIEAKIQQFAADPSLAIAPREDPALAEGIRSVLRAGRPVIRQIRQKPRFAVGDRIMTRNLNPHGHTRLPRYARGKHGVIVHHHGAHVFPDTNAHGLGENPQHLYSVRISARELWGDGAEANESILIDLWESYLEKDGRAVRSSAQRTPSGMKQAPSKSRLQSRKVSARAVSKSRKEKNR